MTEQLYKVVFRGDVVMGQSVSDVKAKLQKLFNADSAKIEQLFSGRPIPIKSGLSEEDAQRYKSLLKNAGAVVSIKPMDDGADKPAPKAQPKPQPVTEKPAPITQAPTEEKEDWSLAPVGATLVKPEVVEAVAVNVDHLSVSEQEGNLIADDERTPELPLTVDVESLTWDLSEEGEMLLHADERKVYAEADVDVSAMSVDESGGDLLQASEKQKPVTNSIDTGHLQLTPSGE